MELNASSTEAPKRPYGLAISLVLLTLSLIGNVFLYSLHLQDKQQDRVDKGKIILESLAGSSQTLSNLMVFVPLLDDKAGVERDSSLYSLGSIFQGTSGSFVTMMDQAHKYSGNPSDWPENYMKTTLSFIEKAGQDIISDSKEDRDRLMKTANELQQLLKGVDISIDSRERALTIQAEKGWPDICLQMNKVMETYLKA